MGCCGPRCGGGELGGNIATRPNAAQYSPPNSPPPQRGPFWDPLGALMGALGRLLERPWRFLGLSWSLPGAPGAAFGAHVRALTTVLYFLMMFEGPGASTSLAKSIISPGGLLALLGASWGSLGALLASLGASWSALWALLAPLGDAEAPGPSEII